MGEIPDRALFSSPELKDALKPYLEITQSVRIGDLANFTATEKTNYDQFVKYFQT